MDIILENKPTLFIDFHADINEETVNRFRNYASDLIKKHAPEVLYLAFSSTGGANRSAFVLYNFLQSLNLVLVTHCTGMVDSCAVSILLAGTTRFINPASRLLIHAPAWTFKAETQLSSTKLKEYVQMMEWDQQAHESIMVERTSASVEQVTEWHNAGKIMTVEESLHYGFFDEVRQFVRPKNVHNFSN